MYSHPGKELYIHLENTKILGLKIFDVNSKSKESFYNDVVRKEYKEKAIYLDGEWEYREPTVKKLRNLFQEGIVNLNKKRFKI